MDKKLLELLTLQDNLVNVKDIKGFPVTAIQIHIFLLITYYWDIIY